MRPGKQGLYDPQFEHDACGVGFVVDIKGRKSHKILQHAIQVLRNLDHRGASGAETNTGDGAGVLLQMPHAFFKEVARKARLNLPPPGAYGSGIIFLPRNPTSRRRLEEHFEQIVQSEGQTLIGWRTLPTDNSMLGDTARNSEPVMRQVFIGPRSGPHRRGGVRTQALRHPQACLQRDPRLHGGRCRVLVRTEPVPQDLRLQGHAADRPAFAVLQGPERSGDGDGAGAGALAFQHQHLPQLGPLASLPLHRPQRRDQHPARQHQLDEGPRSAVRVRRLRRGREEDPADRQSERQRFGDVRQRARTAGDGRALAAACRDDDDPGALVEPRADGRLAAGVLRVPLEPDGAVGTVRPASRSRTGARSARCWIATACVPRATT